MNSPISMKISSRRLILISAAILINASTVLAADRVGDAHAKARDLLSGTVVGTGTIGKSIAIAADHHQTSYGDPQEQARQVIFGNPNFDGLILVLGGGTVNRDGGGNGNIYGAMVVAKFDLVGNGGFKGATFQTNGAGTSTMQYDSAAVQQALNMAGPRVLAVGEF